MTRQELAHISNILRLSWAAIYTCSKNKDSIGEELFEAITDPLTEILEQIVELTKQPIDDI